MPRNRTPAPAGGLPRRTPFAGPCAEAALSHTPFALRARAAAVLLESQELPKMRIYDAAHFF